MRFLALTVDFNCREATKGPERYAERNEALERAFVKEHKAALDELVNVARENIN